MNLVNKFISYVKKVCKNDELCVMVVFVVIGFMLCYLFKDEINGFTLQGSPIVTAPLKLCSGIIPAGIDLGTLSVLPLVLLDIILYGCERAGLDNETKHLYSVDRLRKKRK